MKKLCQVHPLPNKNVKEFTLYRTSNRVGLIPMSIDHNDPSLEYLHLYITSDEKIKEGDWVYYQHPAHQDYDGMITRILKLNASKEKAYEVQHTEGWGVIEGYKKIIGTTDQSLKTGGCYCNPGINWWMRDSNSCVHEIEDNYNKARMCELKPISLPQIPESFIKEYVKAQGKITQVQVEYDQEIIDLGWHGSTLAEEFTPKLTSSNELIISLVEPKMYTRDEVKHLMDISISRGVQLKTDLKVIHKKDHIDKWIEENL